MFSWLQDLYNLCGSSYEYPYTDYSQINLDFVFNALREIGEEIARIIQTLSAKQDKPREIIYVTDEDTSTITVDNINMQSALIIYNGRATADSTADVRALYRDEDGNEATQTGGVTNLSRSVTTSTTMLTYSFGGSIVMIHPKSRATNADLNYRTVTVDSSANYRLVSISLTNRAEGVNFVTGARVTIKEVI